MRHNVFHVGMLGLGALMLLGVAASPAALADEEEVLKIELPEPMFIGTPEDVRSKNLDPKRKKDWKRPPFKVPAGTKLLSEGKAVTSSDPMPIIGELEMVTDGDKEAMEGCYVELGPGKQWVQIDLGEALEITAIAIWHYHSMARIYSDVIVQVSDDKDFTKDVTTVFNNDRDNSSGLGVGKDFEFIETYQGEVFSVDKVKGRYVRVYSNGNTANDMNHYTEVEVFGRPGK